MQAGAWKPWATAAESFGLLHALHEIQMTCWWVTALARLWPGSILAAPAGVGTAAADTLLLCARYLHLVSRMYRVNKLFEYPDQQQGPPEQQHAQWLLPLPAADVTAAVLHTASLLLGSLDHHIEHKTQPAAVAKLLAQPQALQQTALIVATLFGSQLQLNLLHSQQQQESQPEQHSSGSGGGTNSSRDGSSSSSCGSVPPPAAEERAEGVLLFRAQHYVHPKARLGLQQVPQVPVVQSWLQHFEASWGEVLPPHLLQHVAAAIAAAEGLSAPQQHPSTSTAVQDRQPYELLPLDKLLSLEPCLAQVPATAASRRSGGGSGPCFDGGVCIEFVLSAGAVLDLGDEHQPACRRIVHSPGLECAPLLLLASAAAALWLYGGSAWPNALRLSVRASTRTEHSWCQGSRGQPCSVCAKLLKPLAWPTVGLLSLLLQQATAVAVVTTECLASDGSHGGGRGGSGSRAGGSSRTGGCSRGSSSGGRSRGSSSISGSAADEWDAKAPTVACTWTAYLCMTAPVLQVSLSRAVQRASPVPLWPQQLQQMSLTIQILEAAVRCHALWQQLVLQPSEAASRGRAAAGAGAAAAFCVQPMLPASVFACNTAVVAVAHDTRSDVATEVQEVLQAVMSLHLTTLSTAQGQPGAALPAVLLECVKMQQTIVQHATAAAAAGAKQPFSAAVAAGWFVLGCFLLQVSEQLELCVSQPDSHPLSAWLQMSAQVWESSCDRNDQRPLLEAVSHLGASASLLAAAVKDWVGVLFGTSKSSGSSAALWLSDDRVWLMQAGRRLDAAADAIASLVDAEVWAVLLNPTPANLRQGAARQGLTALGTASRELTSAGEYLCGALPNRYFCNNPGCRNAAGVSAGFGLVRGAACVCGSCVGSEGAAEAAAAPQETVAAR